MFKFNNAQLWLQIFATIAISSINVTAAVDLMQLCVGKYMNVIAHPDEPTKFILCLNENTKVGACGTRKDANNNDIPTCFNAKKQACGPDFCAQNPIDSEYDKLIKAFCRDDANLFRYLPAESCESFFVCLGSATDTIKETCPNGQHYSRFERICTNPIAANCQSLDAMCVGRESGYRFASTNCYDYYECQESKPAARSCPYGQHFDSSTQECIRKVSSKCTDAAGDRKPICEIKDNGRYFEHPQCDRFYVCINKVAFPGRCPEEFFFDAAGQACKKDTKNVCI